MSSENPFKITVPDSEIALLKKKLELTRLPDELEDAGHDYGVPLKDIQRLITHWRDSYDWRKHEALLNEELPQFTRDIQVDGFGSLNVHYVHKKSKVASAIPLLFIHGWPGSFIEVRKILPLLLKASGDHPSFHVVAISLPGYGFSETTHKKGFALPQYAEVSHKLMLALGYNEYVSQGGDWGGMISHYISALYGGKHAKAWHSNLPLSPPPHPWHQPKMYLRNLITPLTPFEKAGIERTAWFRNKGQGYSAEHQTQPQTIGYSLADSPVGLLAWIYEKLVNWTDDYPWTDDEVLTWISIYWFSRSGPAASIRIYYENAVAGAPIITQGVQVKIPTGYSYFPKELYLPPKSWTRSISNVVFENVHMKGGHFAAYERPEALVGDLRKMFGKGGPAFGVIAAHRGFKL